MVVGAVSQFLESRGHKVVSAGEPVQGMRMARQEKPDLVLMDYHMPGDTGAHLFEAFRRNREFKDLPVLFMSGSKPEEHLMAEIASRARTAFLPKPVRLETLERTILSLLSPPPPAA